MVILVLAFAVIFLILAILTFAMPGLLIKLINRFDVKWTVDKDLFLNSQPARLAIGFVFLLAAVLLFYSAYVFIR